MTKRLGRPLLAIAILSTSIGSAGVFACSSSKSSPLPPPEPAPASTRCTSDPCCARPEPGTACPASLGGTTCAWAVTCPTGLVLARSTACSDGGVWESVIECPPAGGFDTRGCPAEPPPDESPCSFDASSGPPSCGYARTCAPVCDGGGDAGCVTTRRSGSATCVQGKWQSQVPGPC